MFVFVLFPVVSVATYDYNRCVTWHLYSRSLAAQQRARAKEVLAQNKSMQTTMAIGRKAIQVCTSIRSGLCVYFVYLCIYGVMV